MRREKLIRLRISDDEKELFRKAAAADGGMSLSAWLRRAASRELQAVGLRKPLDARSGGSDAP
jgi:uncharacterized protein (DUF1778 family)